MEERYFETVQETVYFQKLDNGLSVYLLPKKGYSETCGVFATKFGSLQSGFELDTPSGKRVAEKGIAHFLEHRLFDNPRGQIFDLFSKYSAMSNAFTSYDKTAYYFITADNVNDNVNLLLDFVQELSITKESVEKEKGIIIEELRMYSDYPDIKIVTGVLSNLYHNHPIQFDIGGTEEAVRATDLELLESCHRNFYHPSNMVLVVAGKMDVESLMEVIQRNQGDKAFPNAIQLPKIDYQEPSTIKQDFQTISMPVMLPKIAYGYKLPAFPSSMDSKEKNRIILIYSIYLELLFSRSSKYYDKMMKEAIITPTLDASHMQGDQYNCIVVTADVLKRKEFEATLNEAFADQTLLQDEETFLRIKNMMIGQTLRSMEQPQSLALNFMNNQLEGVNVLDDLSVIQSIRLEDLSLVGDSIKQASRTQYIIEPLKKK